MLRLAAGHVIVMHNEAAPTCRRREQQLKVTFSTLALCLLHFSEPKLNAELLSEAQRWSSVPKG